MKSTSILLSLVILLGMASCTRAPEPLCIVEGNLTGLEGDGWIYMTDMWNEGEVIDSTEYHDGVFRFEVSAEEPTMVFLHAGCFNELKGSYGFNRRFETQGIPTFVIVSEEGKIMDIWAGHRVGIISERLDAVL